MKHLVEFLSSGTNRSSKRLFTLIIMLLWCVYFFANLFAGKELKQSFEDNLFYLILFMYAGIAAERLMSGKKKYDVPSPIPMSMSGEDEIGGDTNPPAGGLPKRPA
jgi:hypothetical protein